MFLQTADMEQLLLTIFLGLTIILGLFWASFLFNAKKGRHDSNPTEEAAAPVSELLLPDLRSAFEEAQQHRASSALEKEFQTLQYVLAHYEHSNPCSITVDELSQVVRRLSDIYKIKGDLPAAIRYLQLEKTLYECCVTEPNERMNEDDLTSVRCSMLSTLAERLLRQGNVTLAMNYALKGYSMRKKWAERRNMGPDEAKDTQEYATLCNVYAAFSRLPT